MHERPLFNTALVKKLQTYPTAYQLHFNGHPLTFFLHLFNHWDTWHFWYAFLLLK